MPAESRGLFDPGRDARNDDLEDITPLPPSAPGLMTPPAEHLLPASDAHLTSTAPAAVPIPVWDPPTLPGVGPGGRATAVAEHAQPAGYGAADVAAGSEETPRAQTAGELAADLARASAPAGYGVPLGYAHPAAANIGAGPAAGYGAAMPGTTASIAAVRSTGSEPALLSRTLEPLPAGPRGTSGFALSAYMLRYTLAARRRRRVVDAVERSLQRETQQLDRLLVELGQYSYIERIDLWNQAAQMTHPAAHLGMADASGYSGSVPPTSGDGDLARRAEAWASRLEAEQLRALALLAREEARLSSELLARAERLRVLRWQCELAGVDTRQTQPGDGMAAPVLAYEQRAEMSALRAEYDPLLEQLAIVRTERWMKEHALTRCQQGRASLVATLESILLPPGESGQRPTPNLLLLGALLIGQRLFCVQPAEGQSAPSTFSGGPRGAAGLTMAPIMAVTRFQERLQPRALISAQAVAERFSYDRDAVSRGYAFLFVLAATALLCSLIALWAVTT